MNDGEFESKLRALAANLVRPDPTPAWKADILAHARQTSGPPIPRAPRWLLISLAASWVLSAALRLTTPTTSPGSGPTHDPVTLAFSDETPLRTFMAFRANAELLDIP